jgi:hypothetical protein
LRRAGADEKRGSHARHVMQNRVVLSVHADESALSVARIAPAPEKGQESAEHLAAQGKRKPLSTFWPSFGGADVRE